MLSQFRVKIIYISTINKQEGLNLRFLEITRTKIENLKIDTIIE